MTHRVYNRGVEYAYICKLGRPTIVKSDPRAPSSIATTLVCWGGCNPFPWIDPLTLDLYLIMLSFKQGSIKHHSLSLWYNSTWDWTLVSQTIGKHFTHNANGLVYIPCIYVLILWRGMPPREEKWDQFPYPSVFELTGPKDWPLKGRYDRK